MSKMEEYFKFYGGKLKAAKKKEFDQFVSDTDKLINGAITLLEPAYPLVGGKGLVFELIPEQMLVVVYPITSKPTELTGSVWIKDGVVVLIESREYSQDQVDCLNNLVREVGFKIAYTVSVHNESGGSAGWANIVYDGFSNQKIKE